MTKEELFAWMEAHESVFEDGEHDDRGNSLAYEIYEVNGEHFRVDFCNGYPSEKYVAEKGYVRGVYEPKKVTRKTRIVEEVYWE